MSHLLRIPIYYEISQTFSLSEVWAIVIRVSVHFGCFFLRRLSCRLNHNARINSVRFNVYQLLTGALWFNDETTDD